MCTLCASGPQPTSPFPWQLSSTSKLLILRYVRGLLARSRLPTGLVLGRGLRLELVQLLSTVWDASGQEGAVVAQAHIQEEGMELASALLLVSPHPLVQSGHPIREGWGWSRLTEPSCDSGGHLGARVSCLGEFPFGTCVGLHGNC